jgi:hypothetical protein
MSRIDDPLDGLQIASPCSASWEAMSGNDQVRFCQHCEKNVYNLSGVSRREAEAVVRENEGRLCVRFYRRRDGTVLTDNCPVGLRAVRRRVLTHLTGFCSMVGGVLALARVFVAPQPAQRSVTWSRPTVRVGDTSTPVFVMGSPPAPATDSATAPPVVVGEAAVEMGKHIETGRVIRLPPPHQTVRVSKQKVGPRRWKR